jgi:hypothetical protein
MKNILYKILVLIAIFTISGCAKLEEEPIGLLTPEGFFSVKKDVETSIFGAYGWIASEPLFGRQFICALMLRSDMVDIGNRATSAERIQVNDFNMDSNNGMVSRFWPAWYQVISAVNAAEAGAESLGLPEEDINPLIAEARFVRAFSYYHLVRTFGSIPYIDKPISEPESVSSISKTTEEEIYDHIIDDLEFAKQWLPDKQPGDIRTRPTRGTAASYLASVYLTIHEYQNAYNEAKYVIENKDVFGYALEADFQNLFRAEIANGIKETILAFDFLGKRNLGNANDDLIAPMTGIINYQAGFGVCVPSLNVYQSWDSLDYRRKVSFEDEILLADGSLQPYTTFSTPRPHIAKWRRFPGNANADGRYSDYNYPDFRYAEVLLIAAEALAEVNNGPNSEAVGYINQVRARARNWAGTMTDSPADVAESLDKATFINTVMEERRIELAFEWKRWYDIKRRNLGEEAFKGTGSLEPHANFDAGRDYLMPLPKTELNINPNLNPNNPGY